MKDIKKARINLYKNFDKLINSFETIDEIIKFQMLLGLNIIKAEKEISNENNSEEWKDHIQKIYSIGDSLVWSFLDSFTIRQLGKYEAVKTSLLQQSDVFLNLIVSYLQENKQTIYIFSDITRCLTVGDAIEALAPDKVIIQESKSSSPKNPTFEKLLRGREGRQFSKAFWLSRFFEEGFEKLYGYDKPVKTIEVNVDQSYHFNLIPELIDECLKKDKGTSFIQAEPGVIYIAQDTEKEMNENVMKKVQELDFEFETTAISSTARLIEMDRETIFHYPPLVFPIPLKYRILLNEVDINIICLVSRNYIREITKKYGYTYSENENGFPQLTKNKETKTFHMRFLNNILINFYAVSGVIENMVQLFDNLKTDSLNINEKNYIKDRPKSKSNFIEFLKNNYNIVNKNNYINIFKKE